MPIRTRQPWKTSRARVLRSQATSAEEWMWSRLRGRRLNKLKFVRQAPIGPYYVDFLCREHAIVVEVDGETHGSDVEIANDAERTAFLERQGYRVFRVDNGEVYHNLDGVLDSLLAFVSGSERVD